ncbi:MULTISPECIES: hypothetical protein [Pseudoalteromonas]|uniref:Uncharacterized protein n=1 Tax=Pseudoalteromonas amylolytica TaxID=1859457 RepID=A0A1S1MTB0_9GAMM|nr:MULTISPECIES: hypothetical protein [Pseudoalteromonas]OHU86809.1 hypothetical protein BFC16_15050 [Pseudoalteromonas sp. JW3]OHU88666.1 hypothetical protein BET10_17705 [Pseudoalteromonas amylolytica]
MQVFAYILLAATIKTSLLGLGVASLIISISALILIKFAFFNMPAYQHKHFARAFKIATFTHLSAYGLLIAKFTLLDGLQDIPAFIASHLIVHHILCAGIAGGLTLYGIGIFLNAKAHSLYLK